jgi:branched-chain amino acid transport system permease protein
MGLFVAGVIGGVGQGMLCGLLGFSIVFLFKCTGVANFAQGTLSTFAVFIVFEMYARNAVGYWSAMLLAIVCAAALGGVLYLVIMRPNERAGHLNLTVRTIGLQSLTVAIISWVWGQGQPFPFKSPISTGPAFTVGLQVISWTMIGTIVIAVALCALCVAFFRYTRTGLAFVAVSERPDIARLLGVKTRRLTALAWALVMIVGLIAGVLVAPGQLLSTETMDYYLLLSFTAAIIGGLTSLYGVFVAAVPIGVISGLIDIYGSNDLAIMVIFLLVLAVLVVRPQGLFGRRIHERL